MGHLFCYPKSYLFIQTFKFVMAKSTQVWTSPWSVNIINVYFQLQLNDVTSDNEKKDTQFWYKEKDNRI